VTKESQAGLDAVTTQAVIQEELAAIKGRLAAGATQPPHDLAGDRRAQVTRRRVPPYE